VSVLCSAIASHHVVRFRYLSDPPRAWRWVEPHVLFENHHGKLLLDAVQIAGYTSNPGAGFPVWRQFEVAMITEAEPLADRFDPDPALRLAAERYARVVAAAAP
jgi:hypothetical protein